MSNSIRQHTSCGLTPGDTFSYRRRFSQSGTHRFGELTRDDNPVHDDSRRAAQKHYKDDVSRSSGETDGYTQLRDLQIQGDVRCQS
jgi:hypothetical protein